MSSPGYYRTPRATTCKYDDCIKVANVSGYCKTHYHRAYMAVRNNTSDGRRAGKGNRPQFTTAEVAEARKMRVRFKTNHEIAIHFGVSDKTITKIFSGKYVPSDAEHGVAS